MAKEEGKKGDSDLLAQKLLESRSIVISQEINDEITSRVITQLLLLEAMDSERHIYVYINSPGGSADGGFAIYDMLHFVKPPVRTIAAGLVASAASIILLGASRDNRFAFPHARILIHQPSTQSHGTASDIEITAQEIIKLREKANQLISRETGKALPDVESHTNRDYWISPEEAVTYGLVGRIVKSRAELG